MPANSSHWSRYWAAGALTSLPQDFHENYGGEIAEFWARQVARLPNRATILDVCTGNGAVALLIADQAARLERNWTIIGVDAASIDPASMSHHHPQQRQWLERIRFIADQPFEGLELAPASVELVVSQYGIEYCDHEVAPGKVEALLAPGGRLAMVNHAPDSGMLATMRQEHREYQRLGRLRVESAVRAWLDGKIDDLRLQKQFREARRVLSAEHRRRPAALFRSVLNMLDNVYQAGPAELKRQRTSLGDYCEQVAAARARLADMLRVNTALEPAAQWLERFQRVGLELQEEGDLIYRDQHRAGRYRILEKPRSA